MTHMIFIAAASGDAVKAILLVMKLRWATKGERERKREQNQISSGASRCSNAIGPKREVSARDDLMLACLFS